MKEQKSSNPTSIRPVNETEANHWFSLELDGDRPIINTVKRLDRLINNRFPSLTIRTIDSCSSHLNPDGSLFYEDVGYKEKVEIPQVPHIIFSMEVNPDLVDESLKKVRELLDPMFGNAVEITNQKLEGNILSLRIEVSPTYLYDDDETGTTAAVKEIRYLADITKTESSKAAFPLFWEYLDNQLTNFDGMEMNSEFPPEAFIRNKQ